MIPSAKPLQAGRSYFLLALGLISFGMLLFAFHPLIESGPAEAHSLLLIEHGAKTPWWRFWDTPLAEGPRFLMYASFSLQHAVSGLRAYDYYLVNVILLWISGIFVALFCHRLTSSPAAGALGAMIYWLYGSLYNTIQWLPGRQEPMVVIFGLGALLFVMRPNAAIGWRGAAIVFVLLALSVFSKEYGLVFVAGVGWYVLAWRRDLLAPIWTACASVTLLLLYARIHSAVGVYQDALQCEEMGLVWETRRFCTTTDLSDAANAAQLAWNAAIGLLAQVVPSSPGYHGLVLTPYDGAGALTLDRMHPAGWLFCAFIVMLWLVALRGGMPFLSLALIMIVANTVLSAPFFRPRNVVFGFVSVTAILCYGALVIGAFLASAPVRRRVERYLSVKRWPNALTMAWIGASIYFAAVFAPQMAIVRWINVQEQLRKSTPDNVCAQTAMVINRDLGGGKAVRADIIERILKDNGVAYDSCGIFGT
jgi:hypothetical protein